jgi:GTP-binding protein
MSRFPKAKFLISAAAVAQFPGDYGAEVAFAGRSNAGKSSAINAITQRNSLARTSKTPGQTRLINFFELAPAQRIVDLPGYGYAEVSPAEREQWAVLIDALRARESLVGIFVIVDIRRGLRDGDQQLIDWALDGSKRVHVLLTKADKATRLERMAMLQSMPGTLPEGASAQLFSAHDGTGVDAAQGTLIDWLVPDTAVQRPTDPAKYF